MTQSDTVILIVPPRKEAAPSKAKRPISRSDIEPRMDPTTLPYEAPASMTGMKSPEGIAMPYVIIPRQNIAPKNKEREERWNSCASRELNKLRIASSLVLRKREARSL